MTATPATVTDWTLVSRAKGGRFYRPVANVPTGLDWHAAAALAATVPHSDDVHVWYVPRVSSHAEDRDNVLEDNGRRFPIRWDAAPLVAATADPAERQAAVIEQTHAWGDCAKHTAPDGFRHCHCANEAAAVRAGEPRTCRHCATEPEAAVLVIAAPSGATHHRADNGRTVCGVDTDTARGWSPRPAQTFVSCRTCQRIAAPAAPAARPTMTLTGFGAALLDTAECEHGVPMTDPCGPCAIAAHEPVDVPEYVAASGDRYVSCNGSIPPVYVDADAADSPITVYGCGDAHPFTDDGVPACGIDLCHGRQADDRPAPLTDSARHLADCRGCVLHEPDGHAYESLIDVPITVEELTTLLARTDLADGERAAVALTLTEKVAEREWMDRLAAQTDEEAAAEGWGTDPTA